MNIQQFSYILEIEKTGSMRAAAENLSVAQPNLSRSVRDLETELGITIFRRSNKGVKPTREGLEFIGYARRIVSELNEIEAVYISGGRRGNMFSASVPRSAYITDAFISFMDSVGDKLDKVTYSEMNSTDTLSEVKFRKYDLGIIRASREFTPYYDELCQKNDVEYIVLAELKYVVVASARSPIAALNIVTMDDLRSMTRVNYADEFIPDFPFAKSGSSDFFGDEKNRIDVFDRASAMSLTEHDPTRFVFAAPMPAQSLADNGLIQRQFSGADRVMNDILIYREGYKLTRFDKAFIREVCRSAGSCGCTVLNFSADN